MCESTVRELNTRFGVDTRNMNMDEFSSSFLLFFSVSQCKNGSQRGVNVSTRVLNVPHYVSVIVFMCMRDWNG